MGLDTHNKFRKIHGVPLMTLDRQMCDQAKAYAQKIAQLGELKHSSKEEREEQGENLSMGCSTNKAQAMEEAVTNWYNEVCNPGYNFNGDGKSTGTGHFTQVAWKTSTQLGIGRAETTRNGMQCAYIVGRYQPAGNFFGKFAENVQRGSFDAASYCASLRDKSSFEDQGQAVFEKTGYPEFRDQREPVFS
ncbi:Golgi-associated plant pathogenesis-related protein 1-like [Oculina patagonica]